jgi:invasion protein IalB
MVKRSRSTAIGGSVLLSVALGHAGAGPLHALGASERGSAAAVPPSISLRAPTPLKSARDCRRWQRAAATMGETYGGYRLRLLADQYGCALTAESTPLAPAWSWPWRAQASAAAMPPRLHARFGAWEIRCELLAARNRCALIAEVPLAPAPGATGLSVGPATTHFVIDTVAGRESVIWRIQSPFAPLRSAALRSHHGAFKDQHVMFSLGGPATTQPFTRCDPDVCLMEAPLNASSAAATRLWDGHTIEADLPGPAGMSHGSIAATGFRAAFRELVKLRRAETPLGGN